MTDNTSPELVDAINEQLQKVADAGFAKGFNDGMNAGIRVATEFLESTIQTLGGTMNAQQLDNVMVILANTAEDYRQPSVVLPPKETSDG